jgi:hypothetical protein
MSDIHVCYASDMHPYNCDGPGKCIHCDETKTERHDPKRCWLCHDGDPDGPPGRLGHIVSRANAEPSIGEHEEETE